MAVNKVVYGGETIVDLTADTVSADTLAEGVTAHDKSGNVITGTIATKTASDMTVSGATVTAPAGYYASPASKSVPTATQATPSISVDTEGKITASATQTAGYVSTGTKSNTKQLPVQAAQTITAGTTDQTIASGKYLTGAQTIKGDANLLAENIKSGVSIFGVEGTLEAGGSGSGTMTVEINMPDEAVVVIGAICCNEFQIFPDSGGIGQYSMQCPSDSKSFVITINAFMDASYANITPNNVELIVDSETQIAPALFYGDGGVWRGAFYTYSDGPFTNGCSVVINIS